MTFLLKLLKSEKMMENYDKGKGEDWQKVIDIENDGKFSLTAKDLMKV